MTLLLHEETECLSCKENMEVFVPNVFVSYQGHVYGFNICSRCKLFNINIDIDELINSLSNHKEAEKE